MEKSDLYQQYKGGYKSDFKRRSKKETPIAWALLFGAADEEIQSRLAASVVEVVAPNVFLHRFSGSSLEGLRLLHFLGCFFLLMSQNLLD